MRGSVQEGDGGCVVPQLFPTPPALAARMVEIAGIEPGDRVLEPSAGTGNILRAIVDAEVQRKSGPAPFVVTIEINRSLADALTAHLASWVFCGDFLEQNFQSDAHFNRVLLNPPFANGADCAHIRHALKFLKPGGRLVAICANGPRQQAELRPLATTWEELPNGTFADQGTNVRTVLLTIDA
jgi:protein-L-isoaspartate O-methyltransferase